MSIAWNETTAAHLYRRAAFGGTYAEVRQAVDDGLDRAVGKLVDYESISNSALDLRLTSANFDLTTFGGISRWWITRMMYTARPLEERMTLFLHDHFATAISKVNDAGIMLAQNRLLRRFATGNFTDLTIEISRDPAMLIWLDNFQSRKEHPNENYARELLELFTLGIGHYSELDVMSAARAFTGWSFNRGTRTYAFVPSWHDYGEKDFLGRVGNWNGDDVVRITCSEFSHGQFLASRLFSQLAYEDPAPELVDRLATTYMNSGTSLRTLVEAILKSPEMYSDDAIWRKVKSPIDHTITAWRQLLLEGDGSRFAQTVLSGQGQVPFNPPDVDGWPSGMAWVNSGTLLNRMNFANYASSIFDPARLTGNSQLPTPSELVDFFLQRLGPLQVDSSTHAKLVAYVSPGGAMPSGSDLLAKQRGLAHMILSLPEWQVN